MGQVVTELVISADGSGADQFSQSMDKASASAQQGIGSVAGLTLAVAGVGVAFIGSLVALRGFVDYVGNTNKALIDIATNAANAGMSTKSFQETLFAAKSSGLSDKDFVSGLDKIGADLALASRGATDFGKLFEQNGLSIKNANGELKTTEQALGAISGLIKNAPTPLIANSVASIVGLSKDWIPFLRQGVDEIEAQKKSAADLGVVIDDSTIQKAKDFNVQWHTAIATWDLQFKASLASILPLLVQAATLASKIIDGVGAISTNVSRLMTPDEDKSKQQLNDQINDVARLTEMMQKFGEQSFRSTNLKGALGIPEAADLKQVFEYLDKIVSLYDKQLTRVLITPSGDGSTKLPPTGGGGDANDRVDTAINTLQRHLEVQKADTLAIGLGDAALAGFRAQAAETAAVLANGGKETAEQAAKFAVLKQNVIEATEAFSKAKIANDISFGRKTAFLSQEDVQIATQLKGIYPDVAKALSSVEAEGIRTNNAMKGLSSALETNLTSGLTDILTGTKSVSQGFKDMGLAVVRAIDEMIIKMLIIQPLMRSLGLGSGSLFSLGGGASSTAGVDGLAAIHHAGGIVGGDSMPMRYVHPSHFDSAPKFHGGGIVGDEVPIIAKRGEGVFTQGQMQAMGGGDTHIHYSIDASGADQGTVNAIKSVLAQHSKIISGQAKAMKKSQNFNATGVGG